jgi:ACS family hexuronate transporter-like MFS transporter
MMLVSLISYIDRNTLALLAPTILRETGLSVEQYGYVVSAFSIAYMTGNPLWGMILDRFGLGRGMTVAVGFWSIASGAHALASGFLSFATVRALLGFGEGATFPGGLRTATETLPASLRARGIALAYSGGSLGAIVTPVVITPVALVWGWRGAFIFTALIGAAWLALWTFSARRLPPHRPHTVSTAPRPNVRSPALWAFVSAYALGALPIAFVIYGSALYLGRVRGLSQAEMGTLLWIPPVGWEIGYFFWGWIADRRGPVTNRTAQILFAVLALLSLPLAVTPAIGHTVGFMLGLLFAMFVGAGFIILSIAYATEAFTKGASGLIAGVGAGSWSAAVAVFMPFIGRLFDASQFEQAFLISALIPLAGSAGWFACDRLRHARVT